MNIFQDVIDLGVERVEVAVVDNKMVGNRNRTAFFEVFNFCPVAFVCLCFCEGTNRSDAQAVVAQVRPAVAAKRVRAAAVAAEITRWAAGAGWRREVCSWSRSC